MKKFMAVVFCLTVIFSSLCFAGSNGRQEKVIQSGLIASRTIAKNGFPNIFRPIGNWVKRLFGKKRTAIIDYLYNVDSLTLSKTEIILDCTLSATSGNDCSKDTQSIEVFVTASHNGFSLDSSEVVFRYQVSGGKILGEGKKIVWDLSGVKAGVYTITAAVDNGCGFCGKTITKEVRVIECPDCQ